MLIRRSMVGTANIQLMPLSAMVASVSSASKRSRTTLVPPQSRVGRTLQPPAYTRGATWRVRGAATGALVLITQVLPRIAARAPRWEIAMPFGRAGRSRS